MKCLILAAGYATRLYPLTENFPKPLLDVNGKTILDWLVDDIDRLGKIDEYVVISNHKYAHHFENPVSVLFFHSSDCTLQFAHLHKVMIAHNRTQHTELLWPASVPPLLLHRWQKNKQPVFCS